MILADTSVWIDHLHSADATLVRLLERAEVVAHPFVIEELAMGRLKRRSPFLAAIEELRGGLVLTHGELLAFVESRSLWGKGLGLVDAQLLGSALVSEGGLTIWTRDKGLDSAASALGVAYRG